MHWFRFFYFCCILAVAAFWLPAWYYKKDNQFEYDSVIEKREKEQKESELRYATEEKKRNDEYDADYEAKRRREMELAPMRRLQRRQLSY